MLDLAVTNLSVPRNIRRDKPFNATTIVSNLGSETSAQSSLSFYVSENADQSNPLVIATQAVGSIVGGTSIGLTSLIDSMEITDGRYFWVCIDDLVGELALSNNCSSVVQLSVSAVSISSVLMMLLDEGSE